MQDENVKETLLSFGKVPILVHEAILINIWKNKVLPLLLKLNPNTNSTFIVYSILYHEAVCVALLELVMFHGPVSESLDEVGADLLDYASISASQLLVVKKSPVNLQEKGKKEINRQKNDLAFEIGMRCLTIIRYMAEYLERLPLSVCTGMYQENDVPVLLVQILLERPWIDQGKSFCGGRWYDWDGEALNKIEAQVWLTLHALLLNPLVSTHYFLTESRKTQLLKVLPLLTETLIDQLALLQELKYHLCSLSIDQHPASQPKSLIIENILKIKNGILKENEKKWKAIARQQMGTVFCSDKKELLEIAQTLNEAYNTTLLEAFENQDTGNKCAKCDNKAIQRCSRCKKQWYCSRRCQVEHWTQHKDECNAE
ncbi:zinc finger MYND domain-containing protein 10 isoform X2 [Agrilus planipennis]|nr:zinc finger MYND domain-containing protein 10 isoform X2 [Agrilus planipennis]XP_018329250.1 zinc finger MYND domain-containing protein 10 isoform X2 [Agrilus planipennis]XP_018329258.1 zinc finger MYND domain-containing protein 10 isoform X2 [Agrilus planipennis]XP_018329266.1 zinc finger MYND domain-containing protein 10 isoform X2 [Agrilus planipennis]